MQWKNHTFLFSSLAWFGNIVNCFEANVDKNRHWDIEVWQKLTCWQTLTMSQRNVTTLIWKVLHLEGMWQKYIQHEKNYRWWQYKPLDLTRITWAKRKCYCWRAYQDLEPGWMAYRSSGCPDLWNFTKISHIYHKTTDRQKELRLKHF